MPTHVFYVRTWCKGSVAAEANDATPLTAHDDAVAHFQLLLLLVARR